MTDFQTIEEGVEHLLHHFSFTRDDDFKLIFLYWSKVDGVDPRELYKNTKKLTSPWSIARARRRIQNDKGMYKSSYRIEAARKNKEREYKEWFGSSVEA